MKQYTINNITMSNKKLLKLFLVIVFIITIYLIIYFIPKNYTFKYKLDKFNIIEQYQKDKKLYTFEITIKDRTYEMISDKKYTPKRKLITNIDEYIEDNESCIIVDSKMIDNNILCLKDNEFVDYRLLDKNFFDNYNEDYKVENINYNDVDVNFFEDKTYYVWNYTGFYKINNKKQENINLFKYDVYNINLNILIDKYLVIADYDQKYNFTNFKMLNLENNKIIDISSDYEISFDSEIIGTNKNSFYLVDKKNREEYEINIKKKTVEKVSKNDMGKILKNGKWENIKINKIITDNIKFEMKKYYIPKIENGLYLQQLGFSKNIKISNEDIKNIVSYNDKEVYYIIKDKLYKYDFNYGQREILTYFELNFNYENMIFVY